VLMPSADTLPLGSPIQINIGRKAQEKLACRVTDRRPTL
jgi:hypothetical protein